jgi:RNA polymerase sigma factor (sigma-70 family)
MARTPHDRQDELRRVYRAHVRAVFGFFAYAVGREEAEDLTSQTFERVVRAWDSFDAAKASERTWILSIARNALTDHFRRRSHRQALSTDEHPALLDSVLDTDDPLARQLTIESLKEWLGALGERERLVLALHFGADLSAADIAEATQLSVANVHQIVSRSLRKLRDAAERGLSGSA